MTDPRTEIDGFVSVGEIRKIREEIREFRAAIAELTRTLTDYMLKQAPLIATIDTQVTMIRSDVARVETECDRAIHDVKTAAEKDIAEVKAALEAEKNRRWMVYAAILAAAVSILLYLLQLAQHTGK